MPKPLVGLIAICVLAAIVAVSCAPARRAADSAEVLQTAHSPLGIDYAPETRCSDNNPNWLPGQRPRACNPPPGEPCGDSLSTCPARCQKCYSDDLAFIQRELRVNTIAIYQPNYYIMKAAQQLGMKLVVGVLNDAVLWLATPATERNCSYGGTNLELCGSNYASALIDGVCIGTAGGDPFAHCVSRCSIRSNPARDCATADCSCATGADCKGAGNQCLRQSYVVPLNNSATGEFLRDGTVIGIQLGNEFFEQCQIPVVPGQDQPCCAHNRKTGQCRAWTVDRQVYSAAAQTLRSALDSRGLSNIKISVGLVGGQGPKFCRDGAPPPGIDFIAAHPYCDSVAQEPPSWKTLNGRKCWKRTAHKELADDRAACGAARTFIGETGYNSGNPALANHATLLEAERDYVPAMLEDEPVCKGRSNPTAPFPDFLFEFNDACPAGGCLAGGADPISCNPKCCCHHECSDKAMCGADCPPCIGNGYFGLYRTPDYGTAGFPPEPKFNPMPSLLCPAAQK